jgi:CubicO group peptidase (beta-lactamase class C family)
MTPGWAWEQFKYPWSDPRNNAAAMWNTADVIKYVLERPLAARSGKKFKYSNGAPVVLGEVLHNACRLEVDKLAEKYLFKPLGISRYQWSRYFDGTLETDGGLALCVRDLAKIGQLFLTQGRWQKQQIISPSWIKESTPRRIDLGSLWKWGYGYYWMEVNLNYHGQTIRSFFVPGDGGQLLAVFPGLKMVIVFTGGNYGTDVKSTYFAIIYQHILPAVHLLSPELAFNRQEKGGRGRNTGGRNNG